MPRQESWHLKLQGMQGRVKRKLQRQAAQDQMPQGVAPDERRCALCARPLGSRVEWHHPVPKSEGGHITVPVHPICHRAIHAHVSNRELAERFADLEVLRTREDIQRFLRWVANKPSEFHAPTKRKRS